MKSVLESIDIPEGGVSLAALFDEYSAEVQEHLWIYAFQPEVTEAELEEWSTIGDDVPIRIIRRAQEKIDTDDGEYSNLITLVKDEMARRQADDINSITGAASDDSVHAASDAEEDELDNSDADEEEEAGVAHDNNQVVADNDDEVVVDEAEQVNASEAQPSVAGDDEQMIDDELDELNADVNEHDEQDEQDEQDEHAVEGEEMVVDTEVTDQ